MKYAAQEIAQSEPRAGVVDLVDVVDEQNGVAAAAEFVEQLVAGRCGRAADDVSHLQPAAADNAPWRQNEYGALGALLKGKRF